ncbi:MAG: oligosaccharide flippase family protein [Flavipsychrobacter sp.]|nr:oligosaccharide flippase family protein [Flavipsychrobacter sp.]
MPKAKTDVFFSNSVFIFLTRFFPVLAALLVQVYYSRQLSAGLYGSYQNFWVQLFVFAAVACAGLHVFVITYPADFLIRLLHRLKARTYICFLLWILAACCGFAWLQSGRGYGAAIPFLFLLVHVGSAIAEAFLISFRRLRVLSLVNLVYASLFIYLHFSMPGGGFSVQSLFFNVLFLAVARLVVYLLLAYRYYAAHKAAALATETVTSGVTSLWIHLGLYDMLQILARWTDKFVIGFLFTEAVSGVYFNGSVDIPFLPIILGAAGSAVLIQLAGSKQTGEPAYTLLLAHKSSRFLSAIVFPLFFFFVLFRQELFQVLFTSKFSSAVPIFLASCMAIPVRAYSFTTILQNRGKGALINAGALLDLVVALALLYPLYLWLGLAGIALSFSLATYVQAGFYLYHTSRLLGVSVMALVPYGNWLIKLVVFGGVLSALRFLATQALAPLSALAMGAVATAAMVLLALVIELRNKKNNYAAQSAG